MKKIKALVVLLLVAFAIGCGSTPSNTPLNNPSPTVADIHGSWEAGAFTSATQSGTVYGSLQIELNLVQNGINVSASDTANPNPSMVTISVDPTGIASIGSACGGTGANHFSGSLSPSGVLTFTLTSGGFVFDGTGQLSADHQTISGSYQSRAGSPCTDSGTFGAARAVSTSGPWTLLTADCGGGTVFNTFCDFGGVIAPDVTITEGSNYSVTVNGSGTLSDGTVVTANLGGYTVGNVASVQGTENGQQVSAYAWAGFQCSNDGYVTEYPCIAVFDPTTLNLTGFLVPTSDNPIAAAVRPQIKHK